MQVQTEISAEGGAAVSRVARDYAVLICARNEETVIRDLIESLKAQTYPQRRLHIFVLADNCTDRTADIARAAGARVYTRENQEQVGKGYALEELLMYLHEDHPAGFDGYFVFDADNLLAPDYIARMDRMFAEGHEIITSYRNSKNYGSNWISAGYALWFLRESRYLNHARYLLGTSCAVSGTGFAFSRAVAEEVAGWPYHLLTEDIEFSIDQITHGRKIAFCEDAVLYDEQPVTFGQSVRQRMRWVRGYLQVFRGYGGRLFAGIARGDFSCYDMIMNIFPAFILSAASIAVNAVLTILNVQSGAGLGPTAASALA
ncbi:MAG: glycosyltransferase, partial [Lachnospiraceae bacterium]|nr:glycosyltransferase [Lachnospiraceae bacterium]